MNRTTRDPSSLTKHCLQVVHHNMHIIVTSYGHEKPQMHHIVLSLQFLWQRLEDVEFRQGHVRPVPVLGWVLLIGNVKAIDVCLGQLAGEFSDPNPSGTE